MREGKMRELMQQDCTVPKKVHAGFEKGIQKIYEMDMARGNHENTGVVMGDAKQNREEKRCKRLWRRGSLVVAAACLVLVVGFHSQIYSFARSLFIHETVRVGDAEIGEMDMKAIRINDGVLTPDFEMHYFESMEDLGEKIGVSFMKSSVENEVTGKGRVMAQLDSASGVVYAYDACCFAENISKLQYSEDGETSYHMDTEDAYVIQCRTTFYTENYQKEKYLGAGISYEGANALGSYETRNGLHAELFEIEGSEVDAIIYCDNIRYEYSMDSDEDYTEETRMTFLDTLKTFLDTLER
ncbi:MAG: hypothetical protein Q4D32_02575 [Eubacteriales bacterium]|nr:hypothetical protein [Eubacteriales bacterium]